MTVGSRRFESSLISIAAVVLLAGSARAIQTDIVLFHQKIDASALGGALQVQDGFGYAVTSLGDMDGDGTVDLAVGAEGYPFGANTTGAVYILFMNPDGTIRPGGITRIGEGADDPNDAMQLVAADLFGRSIAALGDYDGDGWFEIAVGAHNGALPGQPGASGKVWILDLDPLTGIPQSGFSLGSNSTNFTALDSYDWFGYSLASLGDWNDDGGAELAVGANGDTDGASRRGAVYLLYLNPPNEPPVVAAGSNAVALTSAATPLAGSVTDDGVLLPLTISWSKLSGPGTATFDDSASPTTTVNFDTAGTYVLELRADDTEYDLADTVAFEVGNPLPGTPPAADPPPDPIPPPPYNATGMKGYAKLSDTAGGFDGSFVSGGWEYFGSGVTAIEDLDGDGQMDLAIGAPEQGTAGGAWITFMDPGCSTGWASCTAKPGAVEIDPSTLGTPLQGDARFGQSLAWLADESGFAQGRLAIGGFRENASKGAVWLLALDPDGSVTGTDRIASQENWSVALDNDDVFGYSVASIGDLNGDGTSDLLVGAGGDDAGAGNEGAVYVMALTPCATLVTHPIVFASPNDDGVDPCQPTELAASGSQTLHLYIKSAARVSTLPGDVCLTGLADGNEMCGWDVRLEFDPNITVQGFAANPPSGAIPATGGAVGPPAGLDWEIVSSSEFRANWIGPSTPSDPTAGAIKIGDLTIDVAGPGEVRTAAGSIAVSAGLQLQKMPESPIAVPEPGRGLLLGCGLIALCALGYRRARLAGGALLCAALLLGAAGDARAVTSVKGHVDYYAGNGTTSPGLGSFGTSEHIFYAFAPIGDLDGDGTVDWLAGGSRHGGSGGPGAWVGRARVLFLDDQYHVRGSQKLWGPTDHDDFGLAVAVLGDAADLSQGKQILAIGAREDYAGSGGPGTEGSVHILHLDRTGTESSRHVIRDGASGLPSGLLDPLDAFGASVALLGDLDGVGGGELALAVGAPGDDDGSAEAGAVWILFLDEFEQVAGQVKIASGGVGGFPSALLANDQFGSAVTAVGDLDGNGVVDLAVGAVGDDDGYSHSTVNEAGAVWILFLQSSGPLDVSVQSVKKLSRTQGGYGFTDSAQYGRVGQALAWLGDPAGQGGGVLAIGALQTTANGEVISAGNPGSGGVYMVHLASEFATTGTVRSAYLISRYSNVGFTSCCSGRFGAAVSAMPDMDGDEVPDLFVGDPNASPGFEDGQGHLLFLQDSDHDGFDDNLDNCPGITGPPQQSFNPLQEDADGDGVGDLCDVCPDVADAAQTDTDLDGEGDACEPVEIQLVTTGTPAAPAWDLKLQCGGFDVTDVNAAIVLPAGATNPKTLTLSGSSVDSFSSSTSGPGLSAPQRSDAIYFTASGNGAPDNRLCSAIDPPVTLGTLTTGAIGGTQLAAAALTAEGVSANLVEDDAGAIPIGEVRLVNGIPLPILDIELGPAVDTASGKRWEVLLRNADTEFHRVAFGLIAPVGTTASEMRWLGCDTTPNGNGERTCTGGASIGATVNAAKSWTVGPLASPPGTQLPHTLYVVLEGNRPSLATLDTLNPINAPQDLVLGTIELDGNPDLEPALTTDGVNDIDDIFNTGTPVAPFEEADFDLADPTQVKLIGEFNPADDVDGDGVQDLADNCPFAPNAAQANRGSFLDAGDDSDFLGDACQCAESTDDGAVLDPDDFDEIRDYLSGRITNPVIAAEIEERCSVAGTTECNLRDLVFLAIAMDAGAPSVETRCDAALSPAPGP